jgi:hypothetical protein
MRCAPSALLTTRTAAFAAVLLSFALAAPASFAQAPAGRGAGASGRQGQQGVAGRQGQGRGGARGRGRAAGPPPAPTPRDANGRAIIDNTLTDKGVWTPVFGINIPIAPVLDKGPEAAEASIPFQPWAKALFDARQDYQFEPHTRCKPSGVARQFITPYGVEFVNLPDLKRLYIFDIGGPHTYRTVYMDGRSHPAHLEPSFYGHSVGWWEGDTLVVDSIGFNEQFWTDRRGVPTTNQLHTIERFTRTNHDTMDYKLTIDDPGAYTKIWTTDFNLRLEKGTELYEYVCQEDNIAAEDMSAEKAHQNTITPNIVP